jgi:branched-chain amino acid transport system ATP-binding protein
MAFWIQDIKNDLGITVLMVEHNMKVVAGISDTITVLARGAVLAEGDYASVSADSQVIEAYMGTEYTEAAVAH